jgi:hypothetical protein
MSAIRKDGTGGSKIDFATEAEHLQAATDGAEATDKKAVHAKGLYWFFSAIKLLTHTWNEIQTFIKAPIVSEFGANRVVTTGMMGKLLATFLLENEFVAVPPTYTSEGTPGQKAWQAPYLYYCVAPNLWIRFLAEGSEFGIQEMYTAVPPVANSPGSQGQRAYDVDNNLMYECVATNTWIRYTITNAW